MYSGLEMHLWSEAKILNLSFKGFCMKAVQTDKFECRISAHQRTELRVDVFRGGDVVQQMCDLV